MFVILLIACAVIIVLQQKVFGRLPFGDKLGKIRKSANYKNGQFQNLAETKMMVEGVSYFTLIKSILNKPPNLEPQFTLPSVKTSLTDIQIAEPVIIWFGHSSYLIRILEKNILVDPIFSERTSPFQFIGAKNYKGTDVFKAEDFPEIDVLILTHDHYDHLDYKGLVSLRPKIKKIYTALGVGSHLENWRFPSEMIQEYDWWESHEILSGFELTSVPSRHFSGRLFSRNKTLWSAFILKAGGYNIFIGSDSGYGPHFKEIGRKFGPFDIALLENGQYNWMWPNIHMMPEETVQAAIDLDTKVLMPVHWGKFTLSVHPWDEPIKRLSLRAKELNVKITTPMIGEPVILGISYPEKRWWETE